ncbi:hypothetical protein [Subtercola vilae]|uniref:hypothetical protein n=1 Tax=Subtercola vilae TaxID=2056433 RepID=UPI0010AA455A|nr:hypothetical protein [Subtercola vilae]
MTYQRRRSEVAAGEVRALLGRNRESIEDLSSATGIPLSTLKRRLLLKTDFTIDEIELIARHYGVTYNSVVYAPQEVEAAS